MAVQGGGAPLTTEEIRDAVARLVEGLRQGDPAELVDELFRDDGDFAAALLEAVPRLMRAAARFLKAFAECMEGMPPEKAADLVARSYAGVDGNELAEALNAASRLVIRLHEENPDLFAAYKSGVVAEAMQATDFGKLRKAITYRASEKLDLARREVELLGDSPLALVNLFSVVAPAVNDALEVLKTVFDILALPPEAVTFALLKIMEDISWRDFAAVVNGAAALTVTLHRGNYILGDGSLYSRGPLARIAGEIAHGLDGRLLSEALAAAGEEAGVFAVSLAEQALEREDLLLPLWESLVSLANSFLHTAAAVLEKACSLRDETLRSMGRSAFDGLDQREFGRALSALSVFIRRMSKESPGVARVFIREALAALDMDTAPASLAARANAALASHNAWARLNPNAMAGWMGEFVAALDARELGEAARSIGSQLAGALERNPEAVGAVLKEVLRCALGGLRGYAAGTLRRARSRLRGVR